MINILRPFLATSLLLSFLAAPPPIRVIEELAALEGIKSPRLRSLAGDIIAGRLGALDTFWSEIQGNAPLKESIPGDRKFMLVSFVWRGDATTKSVAMRGGPPTSLVELPLSRLAGSDLWYRTVPLPRDASFTYYLRVNAPRTEVVYETAANFNKDYPPQADPLNPHAFEGSSLLEMPDAPLQEWAKRRPNVVAGNLTKHQVRSQKLSQDREVEVYTPAGYGGTVGRYSLLIMFDSELYTTLDLPVTLDNLIAEGRIPPTVAVLIHNSTPFDRRRDLSCYDPFAHFVAMELVPWVRQNYRVLSDARHIAVGGASMGGLMACYMGLRYSHVFGNILSQSGALGASAETPRNAEKSLGGLESALAESYSEEPDWLMQQFIKSKRLPLRFYIEAQRYDVGLYGADILASSRHMRDVLRMKGYFVTHREFNGGHDGYTQRGTVAGGLMALLGDAVRPGERAGVFRQEHVLRAQ
ncbi:MAG TPA: alpha/beta hydrolase-fold protein [Pyrinomonadaceae bacterium]|jgi:enterochelin esterase family protein